MYYNQISNWYKSKGELNTMILNFNKNSCSATNSIMITYALRKRSISKEIHLKSLHFNL